MKKTVIVIILIVIGLASYMWWPELKSIYKPEQQDLPQGKLDINTVCQNALISRTFPSSAEADQFVLDCKDGKYPEVIEEYKKNMNLGDGATI